jgi:predicted xylose isomerase-like sugar epimerase
MPIAAYCSHIILLGNKMGKAVSGLATVRDVCGVDLDVYYHLDGDRIVFDSVESVHNTQDIKTLLSLEAHAQIRDAIRGNKNG